MPDGFQLYAAKVSDTFMFLIFFISCRYLMPLLVMFQLRLIEQGMLILHNRILSQV